MHMSSGLYSALQVGIQFLQRLVHLAYIGSLLAQMEVREAAQVMETSIVWIQIYANMSSEILVVYAVLVCTSNAIAAVKIAIARSSRKD